MSVSVTNQDNIKNVPENVTKELTEKEKRQVGLTIFLRKSVIHLSYAEFTRLTSSTDSSHSLLKLLGNDVKCPIESADERQQHQASEASTNP